jgi:two-component system KDP operon response regulator KdpE
VCDPDTLSLRAVQSVLQGAAFTVVVTQTSDAALSWAASRMPDVAIVEMDLDGVDGADVCCRLREWSSVPLLVLAHLSDETRVVRAFRAGADDYITKPFRPAELVARIEAHLRRAAVPREDVLAWGDVRVDLVARVATRQNSTIHLTPTEHKLLSVLARNQGRLVTHRQLLSEVWGAAYSDDRQVLRAHVANLRRKLSVPNTSSLIHTYQGVGYLLDGKATRTGRSDTG